MSKRLLALCLAMVLCLSLIPATAFAAPSSYEVQEIRTGISATNVAIMYNGYGTYKATGNGGAVTRKGVVSPDGKSVLTRAASNDPDGLTSYESCGDIIVDLDTVYRYGFYDGTTLYDTYSDGMNYYPDINIYNTSGSLTGHVSDIVAAYEGLRPQGLFIDRSGQMGDQGLLRAEVMQDENGEIYTYHIDPLRKTVAARVYNGEFSPLATAGGIYIACLNDGWSAFNESHGEWRNDTDIVTIYDRAGWVDINGNQVLSIDPDAYSQWYNFSDSYAKVQNTGGKYGFIDKTGNPVISCQYTDAGAFGHGYSYAANAAGVYGYIDKDNKTVIPFQYGGAKGNSKDLFTVASGGKYGIVDLNNEVVVPFAYDDITYPSEGTAYAVKGGEVVVLKISDSSSGGAGASYDFTPAESGIGSHTANESAWTWGERASLPKDVAAIYHVLADNSVSGSFLTADSTWKLPKSDAGSYNYPVDVVQVCEDHEPAYLANGDGKVDESTFGNAAFYTVAASAGDAKVNYPDLTTGDVVSNTSFNGVFVTKLQKTGNETFETDLATLKSDVIASFRAFELDHPEVFWLTGSVKLRVLTVTIKNVQTSYIFITLADSSGFSMLMENYIAAGAIEAAIKTRDSAAASILAEIPASGTAREKIAALNKWLTMHNEYNRSSDLSAIGYLPHRALAALTGNEGTSGPVCDGYSRAFKLICDCLEIPCILDTGMAVSGTHSEYHMWNRVQIDGVWYGMDCTWDDPIVKGISGKVSGHENEKYLLVGNDTEVDGVKFGVSHTANETAGGTTNVLFASLTISGTSAGDVANIFKDVPAGAWYAKFLQKAFDNRIITGTSATTYAPNANLNHGQIMVIAANLHSKQKEDGYDFQTNKKAGTAWYQVFEDYCKAEGIIDGRFDGKETKNVTRDEMAYYFANTLTDISYADKKTAELNDIAGNPYEAEITKLAKADIVGGKGAGKYDPSGLITRADAAVFISNILDAIEAAKAQ